jgi:hypothetical protein
MWHSDNEAESIAGYRPTTISTIVTPPASVHRSVSRKWDESITKVAADDAVPGRAVVLVELLLDVLGDVLLHGVLLERLHPEKKSPNGKKNTERSPAVRTKESGRAQREIIRIE